MVKSKTIYVCQNCGAKETKWTGRCNVCGEWNSFVEEVEVTSKSRGNAVIGNPSSKALRLSEIKVNADVRMDTGDNELNRVLGGEDVSQGALFFRSVRRRYDSGIDDSVRW